MERLSASVRIMVRCPIVLASRYGDTSPAGMVEATMEYLRVCQACDFKDVVISAEIRGDCRTMVDAVRLLVEKMEATRGNRYPLHFGSCGGR